MTHTMVFAISVPSSLLDSSFSSRKTKTSSLCYFSSPANSIPNNATFQQIKCIPQLGLTPFSQWNGLKRTISQYSLKIERKEKCTGKGVYASLFGVGAPEVLVIGVVALLVFGPKGLAEVARNLGKTLRAFQPTIRELQEVSREFKSTLEREIGLDEPVPRNSRSDTPGATIDPKDDLKTKADKFRGALAQLQKEQEEEREREKEKVKKEERAPSEAESQPPSTDGFSPENAEDDVRMKADKFRGALAQLQKEQEEEREKEKEKEEERAPSKAESQSPSTVAPVSENADNITLQETPSEIQS